VREEGLTRGRAGRGTVAGERSGPVSNDGGNICALLRQLRLEMCRDVLVWSGRYGMQQLEAGALELAAKQFEEFAKTVGFARMGEEALMAVMDDDRLVGRSEEAVWEVVVAWMRDGAAGSWPDVVSWIRFPLIWRRSTVEIGGHRARRGSGVDGACVVAEARRAKAARREGAAFESELLGRTRKALEDRVGLGVRWGRCGRTGLGGLLAAWR
jgi:hypothetical protein